MSGSAERSNQPANPYTFVYSVPRTLATLVEFHSCLSQVLASPEFKGIKKDIGKQDWEFIDSANRYFLANFGRLKELRDAVGGHVSCKLVWTPSITGAERK